MNIAVYLGIQSAFDVQATTFKKLAATDAGLSFAINHIDSQALTGSRFSEAGVSKIGDVGGSVPTEISRESLQDLLKIGGFNFATDVSDLVGTPVDTKIATYGTIVVEDLENGMHEIYKNVILNTATLQLAVDSFAMLNGDFIAISAPIVNDGAFGGTVNDYTDAKIYCDGATILNKAADISAKVEGLTLTINNNCAAVKSVNDTRKLVQNKSEISLNYTLNEFDKSLYLESFTDIGNDASQSVTVTLNNGTVGEDVVILLPKLVHSGLSRGDVTGSGKLTKDLAAKKDATDGVIKITLVGMAV